MKKSHWLIESLGRPVETIAPVGEVPAGCVGYLVSIQSGYRGHEPWGIPHATVCFDPDDWSQEHNVPLDALRPAV